MTKTAQRQELALADLDTVIGGSASAVLSIHPLAIAAGTTIPGVDFSSTYVPSSAANNYGLADHFTLAFGAAGHDGAHATDHGIAPSVPGQLSAPVASAAATVEIDTSSVVDHDAHPHGGCHGAAGTDDHATQGAVQAQPLSLMPNPGDGASSTATTSALPASADAGAPHYLGLPGGTDEAHDSQPITNDWAPGSLGGGAASSATTW